jgi:hypothetical protein
VSTNLVRMKFSAPAAKIETTIGTDAIAGSPAAGDWIGSDCEIDFDPQILELNEYTGSMDKAASIAGGLRPRIRLRMPLRGSGAAATAPEWGKLLRCCTYLETYTAAAVGAPTAAASGTTTTVTAAAPFAATADLYRGMPLLVTGDQTTTTGILDYTVGRVITFGETRAALTTSSLLQIPINYRYSPTSDESNYKTATLYFYSDGWLQIFTGCSGTWSLELTTGGIGYITFELRGQYVTPSATAMPSGAASAAVTRTAVAPPRFVSGKMQLNKQLAQVNTLSVAANVTTILPDDPESAEGYGPALSTDRAPGGSMNPYVDTTKNLAIMNAFRLGTSMNLMAQLGSTAGNRFIVMAPAARATGVKVSMRDGAAANDIQFQCDGADVGLFIAAF